VPDEGGGCLIRYPIGSSGETIVFAESVVSHLMKHRQNRPWRREAGGQLFARFGAGEILIEEATGPRPTDSRGRTYYRPDRRAEQKEILERFERGLHYVGDWHTHPSEIPEPSGTDVRNINECFKKSRHSLNGFILVLVGMARAPRGLRVSVHDGSNDFVLESAIEEISAGGCASCGLADMAGET
jgi:integrative and conjugative element protein (TIGR02256 family)